MECSEKGVIRLNPVSSDPSGVSMQLGLFDAIKDLLVVKPVLLLGLLAICTVPVIYFKKNGTMPKIRVWILWLVFYYYLCVMLTKIVGLPTIREYIRLSGLGEAFFQPNINLIPFSDGFSLSFLLNIALFVPLGFLCPLISQRYRSIKNTLLLALGVSLSIEILQLFTLYRATDIDDLITNVVGALIGYLCVQVVHKLVTRKSNAVSEAEEAHYMRYIPTLLIVTTFLLNFFT